MFDFFLAIVASMLYSVATARLFLALDRADGSMGLQRGSLATAGADRLDTGANSSLRRGVTFALAAAGALLHGWVALQQAGLPAALHLPFFVSLSASTLMIVVVQVVLGHWQPTDYLGLAVYPLAAVTLLASTAIGTTDSTLPLSIEVHVLLSMLAYSILALAAVQAGLVTIQRHYLSNHRPGGFMRVLPPFELTERLLFWLLGLGFVVLTLSLGSGFLYLENLFAQKLVHKTVLSIIAWGVFGVLLFGRWQFGWRGRRAVHLTLLGFALLILAYFGSKLVLELILQGT